MSSKEVLVLLNGFRDCSGVGCVGGGVTEGESVHVFVVGLKYSLQMV